MASDHTVPNRLWLLGVLPLAAALYFLSRISEIAAGQPLIVSIPWVPALNVSLSFFVDGLAALMVILVLGIGGLILIYASGYMAGNRRIGRFYAILIFFMLAMVGVVLADNVILLFIFWELTSISSFLLIGFSHENVRSQKSAQQALVVTGLGGLALLAGLILLANIGGSWQLSTLLADGVSLAGHPAYPAVLILVLIGAFTKSAQFPFHFWLPNAMAAPTPVSAYLHSATMVKAGIYLLARLHPILGDTAGWFWTLVVIGSITGLMGGWLAWQQNDLKRVLAYTTISALGILVFLLGIGDKLAVKGAVLFLLVHSLYKGALFMIAGAIDHETGTRDIEQLGGLWRKMPLTTAAAVLATLSMAGIPPLIGFVGKEVIYEATIEHGRWVIGLTAAAFLMNLFNVAAAFILAIKPFWQENRSTKEIGTVREGAWTLWLGPLTLGLTAAAAFFFVESEFFSQQLIRGATVASYGNEVDIKLYALPAEFTIVPLLSLLTIAGGFAFFRSRDLLIHSAGQLDRSFSSVGPEMIYERGLSGLLSGASKISGTIQNGKLRRYVLYVVASFLLFVGGPLVAGFGQLKVQTAAPPRLYEIIIACVIIAAGFMVTAVRSRLAAVAALGVVGYGAALLFLYLNAPDLAMTQFSIETLSVILFVLVLYRLPVFKAMTSTRGRWRDIVIATLAGTFMGGLVLLATTVPQSEHVIDYYASTSYSLAKGKNIVNVILVDYRGFDTMVEITVLAVAAIGVYGLIRRAVIRRFGPEEEQ